MLAIFEVVLEVRPHHVRHLLLVPLVLPPPLLGGVDDPDSLLIILSLMDHWFHDDVTGDLIDTPFGSSSIRIMVDLF